MTRYHFIGIGGYGMSAIAYVLARRGHLVQGSDVQASSRTQWLKEAGVVVHQGHDAAWLDQAERVVFSTDIPADNVELQAARARELPVLHRSQVLAELLSGDHSVAVTGTHGKTTVTAMLGLVLVEAGRDPTILVGGELDRFGGTARAGSRETVVAEACESDGSFLRYRPRLAVITNQEAEHLNHYGGDVERMEAAFRAFLYGVQPGGAAVLCWDDARLRRLVGAYAPDLVTYGFHPDADVRVVEARQEGWSARAQVRLPGDRERTLQLQVPGRHNIQNAAGVVAAARQLGVTAGTALGALEGYRGVKRRFQLISEPGAAATIIDDYAHHPTEIEATLAAAAAGAGGRVLAVFQPQRYSRTQQLMDEFASAFSAADVVVITEIYSPPGEEPVPGVSGEVMAARIQESGHGGQVRFLANHDAVEAFLQAEVRPGDTVLTMGAGDIWKAAERLAAAFAAG